jgi:hypothetical protein
MPKIQKDPGALGGADPGAITVYCYPQTGKTP